MDELSFSQSREVSLLNELYQQYGGEYILENIPPENVRILHEYIDRKNLKNRVSYCDGTLYLKHVTIIHEFIKGLLSMIIASCHILGREEDILCYGSADIRFPGGGEKNTFEPTISWVVSSRPINDRNLVIEVFHGYHTRDYSLLFQKVAYYFDQTETLALIVIIVLPEDNGPNDEPNNNSTRQLGMACVTYFRESFHSLSPSSGLPRRLPIPSCNGLVSFGSRNLTKAEREDILFGVRSISSSEERKILLWVYWRRVYH